MGKRPKSPPRPAPKPGRSPVLFVIAAVGLLLVLVLAWKMRSTPAPAPTPPPSATPRPETQTPPRPTPPPTPPETTPDAPGETASIPADRRPTLPSDDGEPEEPEDTSAPDPDLYASRPDTSPTAPTTPSTPAGPLEGRHAFAGLPVAKPGMDVVLLENVGFAVGYSEERKDPLWVAYHLRQGPPREGGKRPGNFRADARTRARVKHEDYKQDDYTRNPQAFDRGHMAPNHAISTYFGREAQLETFLMTNVCPQRKHLNQQTWEALEKTIADEWVTQFKELWVTVGPIFGPSPQRLNGVSQIPDAFFCLVLEVDDEGKPHLLSLRMGQEVSGVLRLRPHLTATDDVERATGLDFFAELADAQEAELESGRADDRWKLDLVREPSRH